MEADAFRRLVSRIDPGMRLLRAWPLVGGVSAQVTALEVQRPDGGIEKLVARLHGPRDLGANANIARDEFRLLQIVESHGIAAPRAVFLDASCELFPTPIVVATFIEGVMIDDAEQVDDGESVVRQMADQLAAIHRVPDSPELAFLPQVYERFPARSAVLDESMGEGRIRETLDAAGSPEPLNAA